jgi:hypothetical protein
LNHVGNGVLKLAHVVQTINTPIAINKITDGTKLFGHDLGTASLSLPSSLQIFGDRSICTLVGFLYVDAGLFVLPNYVGIEVTGNVIQTYTKWRPPQYYPV